MDKLSAMRMFVATVNGGGLTAAARALGASISNVSRMIANLEAELGVTLLHRTTRRVRLTERGSDYYQRASSILAAIEAADLAAVDAQPLTQALLKINAPMTFGNHVVLPLIPTFLAAHTNLQVILELCENEINVTEDEADISISLDCRAPAPGMVSCALGTFRRRLVASGDYLAANEAPQLPADLAHHSCLTNAGMGGNQWKLSDQSQCAQLTVDGPLRSDHLSVLRFAALQGAGIALLPEWLVADDLATGRLITVLPDFRNKPSTEDSIEVHYYVTRHGMENIQNFIDLIDCSLSQLSVRAKAKDACGYKA